MTDRVGGGKCNTGLHNTHRVYTGMKIYLSFIPVQTINFFSGITRLFYYGIQNQRNNGITMETISTQLNLPLNWMVSGRTIELTNDLNGIQTNELFE